MEFLSILGVKTAWNLVNQKRRILQEYLTQITSDQIKTSVLQKFFEKKYYILGAVLAILVIWHVQTKRNKEESKYKSIKMIRQAFKLCKTEEEVTLIKNECLTFLISCYKHNTGPNKCKNIRSEIEKRLYAR
ncbi:unnamed protein product [Moneuplotes crassus]|uniref:Uncharacterized protein n=1 Tax=Euplotes crassus TaxID=5936 RepID=A0AAD1Y0K2_EUPCR|nr:unnamed protein product [Moneuplotes crassus]